jgi:hypothetical protein
MLAAPRQQSVPSRSSDLSAVLADMDDGNRSGRVPVLITQGMKSDGIELVIHRLTLGRRRSTTLRTPSITPERVRSLLSSTSLARIKHRRPPIETVDYALKAAKWRRLSR